MSILVASLILLAVLAMAALAVSRPAFAVAVFVALMPTYLIRFPLVVSQLPTTLLEVLFGALFVGWLIGRDRKNSLEATLRPWVLPVTLFLVGATVSILVSPDWRAGLGIWRAYFLEPLLFFIVAVDVLRTEKDRDRVLVALSATVIIVGLMSFVQKFTGWWIPNPIWAAAATRRVTAFYGYPNAIALFVAPTVVLLSAWCFKLISSRDRREQLTAFPLAAVLLGCAAIIFAVSKGGMIAVAVGIIALGLMMRLTRVTTLIAIIISCLAVLFIPPVMSRAAQLISLRDASGSVRASIWGETMNMLGDHPVFGAGLAGYQKVFDAYHQARYIEIFTYPHNIVLNFWAETGLIGLIGFIWIVVAFFWVASRAAKKARGGWWTAALAASLIAIISHGLVDVPYFKNDLAMQFWLLAALLMSAVRDEAISANPFERIESWFSGVTKALFHGKT